MFADNLQRIAQESCSRDEIRERMLLASMSLYRSDQGLTVFRQDVLYDSIPQWNLEKLLCIKLVIDHNDREAHVEFGIDIGDGYERVLKVPKVDSLSEWTKATCMNLELLRTSQGVSRFFYEAVRQHPDSFQRLLQIIEALEWCLSLSPDELQEQWAGIPY